MFVLATAVEIFQRASTFRLKFRFLSYSIHVYKRLSIHFNPRLIGICIDFLYQVLQERSLG